MIVESCEGWLVDIDQDERAYWLSCSETISSLKQLRIDGRSGGVGGLLWQPIPSRDLPTLQQKSQATKNP
ncbi:hypothetical protein, partial [Pseudomonas sp. UBA6315]|uniref:hypothetical protein n=1 Tax=Pseudomonas sp. UBA6315 TaxID=1947328 RepID=UPI00257D82CB